MYVSVIIVAAGKGERLNSKVSKQFLEIDGRPILAYTIEKFSKCNMVDEIVIVTKEEYIEFCQKQIVDKYNLKKVTKIIMGGEKRQNSVYNGLKALSKNTDIVLIHDGVRPFIETVQIENLINNIEENPCCVLGVPSKDTIKVCDNDDFIVDTPDRNHLWAVQTPQGFKYDIIMDAHEKTKNNDFEATDDGVLLEKIGYKVKIVMGSYFNIKITTKEDLIFAESILKNFSNS